MAGVGWRGLLAVVVIVGAVILALVGFLGGGGASGIAIFNGCISHTRYLVLVHEPRGSSAIETIHDRAHGGVVAEVTGAHGAILPGAAAATGRYTMSTATPLGRDATAIERCWDKFSPVAPPGE